jgi:hypothetical protein
MTGPVDLARGMLLAALPSGWQLWRADGRALWLRPVKTYNAGADRVASSFEILGPDIGPDNAVNA